LHFQAIVAGKGLNTASRLISTLIARHHPTAKKLFARGPRVVGGRGGKLELVVERTVDRVEKKVKKKLFRT
jgi:hypothetical protein